MWSVGNRCGGRDGMPISAQPPSPRIGCEISIWNRVYTCLPVGGLSRWSSKTHSLQPGDASSTSKKSKYGYEMILRWQSALPRIVAQARGILISPWVCHVKEYKQGAESKVVPYILLCNGKVLIFGIRKQQKTPSSKQVITRS